MTSKHKARLAEEFFTSTERALKRAAKRAYARAIETGTPFIVYKNGKIVDLNRGAKPKKIVRDIIW